MNGGARIGFGEHQQLRAAGEFLQMVRQFIEAGRHAAQLWLAQHAETRIGDNLQAVLAIGADQIVVAVAHKREVIVARPVQERACLIEFFKRHHFGRTTEVGQDVLYLRLHLRPVLDRRTDV